MGGRSESGIFSAPGAGEAGAAAALFRGLVTDAGNGGFASVRSRNFEPALNLSSYDGIKLRVKGDGQRYKFTVRTQESWDGVGYCMSVDTQVPALQNPLLNDFRQSCTVCCCQVPSLAIPGAQQLKTLDKSSVAICQAVVFFTPAYGLVALQRAARRSFYSRFENIACVRAKFQSAYC